MLDRQQEGGGNTRGMPGEKNWADMSTNDLENAARDNHDRPVGTFMGDYHAKGKEGPEEAVSRERMSLDLVGFRKLTGSFSPFAKLVVSRELESVWWRTESSTS